MKKEPTEKEINDILLESFDKLVECNHCKELITVEAPHELAYCPKCDCILAEDEFTIRVG